MVDAEGMKNVQVTSFNGLLVDYAHAIGAVYVIRGLRATMDFEYEFQINALNLHLAPDVETVYFMARPEHSFFKLQRDPGDRLHGWQHTGIGTGQYS